jgi:hypothetical protein
VLRVYAHLYVEMGRSLQYWLTGPHSQQDRAVMPQEDQVKIRQDLEGMMIHAKELNLPVTQNFVMEAAGTIGAKPVTGRAAAAIAGGIAQCFRAEIQSRSFFCLLQGNDSYWPFDESGARKSIFGAEIQDRFTEAVFDMDEACMCAATGRYTACVFHLMRLMECALKLLGSSVGIPYAPSWESYLNQIKRLIERDHKLKSSDWISAEPFYKEVLGDLQAIKIAWRNPTMHIVRSYGPDEAEQIIKAVNTFTERIAGRFPGGGPIASITP